MEVLDCKVMRVGNDMLDLGFNYRLTDFQASLGVFSLKKADKWLKKEML